MAYRIPSLSTRRKSNQRVTRRVIPALFGLWLLAWPMAARAQDRPASGPPPASASREQEIRPLERGQSIEREMAGGQNHAYRISLIANQFLHVAVEQMGIDVVVFVFGSDGRKLVETDSPNGARGPESVLLIAETSGVYRLEVRSPDKEAKPGRYEIKVAELRASTGPEGTTDRARVAAQRTFDAAEQLRTQGGAEASRQAIAKYEESLPLWRAANDLRGEAQALHEMGGVHRALGDARKALEIFNRALPLRRAAGDRKGEAYTLNNTGLAYADLSEWQKALDYYQRSLAISREIGNRFGEGQTLSNIGSTYSSLGDKQKALEFLQQALAPRREAGDREGEAYTLNNIGIIHRTRGDLRKALECYEQAREIWRAEGDRGGEAMTLNNISVVYGHLGQREKMIETLRQSLPLRRAVGDRRGEAYTLTNIGAAYQAAGDRQAAAEHYDRALRLMRETGDRSGEMATLGRFAALERERGNLAAARAHTEAALDLIETLRAKVTSQELRTSFFASVQRGYGFYIDLLMEMHGRAPAEGHAAAALQASERGRARSLLELLAEARAEIRQGVDSKLIERERALQQQISAKEQQRLRLFSGQPNEEKAAALLKEIRELLTAYQDVRTQIRAASPRYAAIVQPRPSSLAEIQQLLDPDTVLLEFALGEQRSHLWAVTKTAMSSHELPKRAEVEALARRVTMLFSEAPHVAALSVARDPSLAEAPAALSRMLLGPVASQLGAKRLLIVADGALQYLPFAALPDPNALDAEPSDRRPLAAGHEIVHLPSASTLAALRREFAGRQPAPKAVAALADPVFAPDDERLKANAMAAKEKERNANAALSRALQGMGDRGAIKRLPFSRQEAEAILRLAPKEAGMMALDFQANRATATSAALRQYRIIHFATHGLLNDEHPELSGIVLTLVDEQGAPQEGFLQLHDIYNLDLPAELVVLSACQTGLGKEIKGEGLVGLTRGFMYAGAPRVVASLWKVSDEATQELMKRFYQGILGEKRLRPAAALREAQIELMKEKRWESPYYWAAFVIQGDWR